MATRTPQGLSEEEQNILNALRNREKDVLWGKILGPRFAKEMQDSLETALDSTAKRKKRRKARTIWNYLNELNTSLSRRAANLEKKAAQKSS